MSAPAKVISEAEKRRTFAIISHPDAGKTTLTEKLLLLGNAIQVAGEVKGRRADRHATSDWMEMEQQRGISVTTSVMQFPYRDRIVNLLDTPGHADFSEDTYRTLTAVDSALMVIDVAKGVEQRTIKLMEVCRLRTTPIFTFINKLDREGRDPIDLMDEVEEILNIRCTPMTWPIGMGKRLKGIYHLHTDEITLYEPKKDGRLHEGRRIKGIDSDEARAELGDVLDEFREELELVQGASHEWNLEEYLRGELTPVYFGTALNTFGIAELMTDFVEYAPPPQNRSAELGGEVQEVSFKTDEFTGFVFKIQANMDPKHRDRVAFMRICSGKFEPGKKLRHVRLNKDVKIADALTFLAADRGSTIEAYPGDIIGLHNHGTINIGDSFTEGTPLQFTGIPNFAPELFRRAVLKDPLKMKALLKGLEQLCEEGATQLFKPMRSNELILGAVGPLQFEVVAHRLKHEYKVECLFEGVQVATARWVSCDDEKIFEQFKRKAFDNLSIDHGNALVYVAPTRVNLALALERHPEVRFHETREHSMSA